MRKHIALICLFLLCLNIHAQEAASMLFLSHCEGVLAPTGVKGCSGQQWNAVATRFSADDVAVFVGNEISAVRVGMASKLNIEELTFWVRTSLDGANLAEASTTQVNKGWIELSLTVPFAIEQAQELYIGMSYRQKGSSKCLAVNADRKIEGGFYFQQGENDWTDCSNLGIACIEGCVTGSNLPQYDLSLSDLETNSNLLIGGEMTLSYSVANHAAATITGFTTRIKVDDAEPVEVHHECALAYRQHETFSATIVPDLTQAKMNAEVKVELVAIDGGEDICRDDNMASTQVNLLSREYQRHMLIEEFTGERCVNCPGAASMLHQLLEEEVYQERVSAVCHHIGYGTDWLTTDNATQYLWFYNSTQTYAPGFMWDRTLLADQSAPVTFCPSTLRDMRDIVDARLATTAMCEVNATASYDDVTQKLKVSVSGERCAEFSSTPARITVFVTEDNIQAQSQSGATTSPYYHQHVLRGYNATFGSVIEWNEDQTFSYDCQIEIRPEWDQNELHIVVFVGSYDASDPTNCAIENSCEIDFPTTEGIEVIATDVDHSPIYFSPSGLRVTHPQPGMLLLKR